jgi:hypothetical protein
VPREYRILHHRQSHTGGHWDLVENPIPYRSHAGFVPEGDGSLCGALEALGQDGWLPLMDFVHVQAQPGESFVLLYREKA